MVQIRIIFSIPSLQGNQVYFYGDAFRFSPRHKTYENNAEVVTTAPGIDMFLLHRHFRAGNVKHMGDIYPITSIREIVDLAPVFGRQMDKHMDCNNSFNVPTSFYLNNFSDKETFHSILTYQ